MDIIKHISIDKNSRKPKYLQIVDSISYNILAGNLTIGQQIPSINTICKEYYLSKDTVEKAYKTLKKRNIINSIHRKGCFINNTMISYKVNVLFLIDKLSTNKMTIYNTFIDSISPNSNTDLYIYHSDESLFLNSIERFKSDYDYFVIIPPFKSIVSKHVRYTDSVVRALKQIPKEKLIILDNAEPKIDGEIGEIYQDFERGIYTVLKEGFLKISSYKKITLVYSEKSLNNYPIGILNGFRKFCIEHELNYEIIDSIFDDKILTKGELFITIKDKDLVNLINQIRTNEYILGTDIGVISYNDTPFKKLLGISVISADLKIIGETAANMILNNVKGKIKVPFSFIDRSSI